VHKPRPRLDGFDYTGFHRYFLTFCTANRLPAFVRAPPVDLVWSQILRAADGNDIEIAAYCFMPDHLHLLAAGTSPSADLRRFVRDAKQYSGFHYKQEFGRGLWQPSYYDHVIRDEESTWSVARYIVENPITAGLAASADAYPFLGSGIVTRGQLLEYVAAAERWKRR
jgi:putative transposase